VQGGIFASVHGVFLVGGRQNSPLLATLAGARAQWTETLEVVDDLAAALVGEAELER
jgi:hypothetical protein